MASASESLAVFAAELEYEAIPAGVIERIKLHLLDLLGVALASSSMTFGRDAVAAARDLGGRGSCTVIGSAVRLPGVWAALANGTLGHGIDYDDTHQESVVHVSAGIVPAALAAVEESGAGGLGLLGALAVGMETSIRIGLAARGGFHDRGFHPTGVCNAFGAALLVARVQGLDASGAAHALGIAGSQAAGLLEFLSDGSDVKRIHGGWAAHAGLVAARLARHGLTGPRQILEGRLGFFRAHLGASGWDPAAVTADLGRRWHCAETGLKPYPACHYNHAFADAALRLKREHGVRPADVERVECLIDTREIPIVCEPVEVKRAPQTEYGAKFSLPYAVASILVRGTLDIDDFTPAALADPEVRSLCRRVEHVAEPAAGFPRRFGGRLRLHLRDGRVLEAHEAVNRGSAERPLTPAEVEEKFRRNAARALPELQVGRVLDEVAGLEGAPSLHGLCTALRPQGVARRRRRMSRRRSAARPVLGRVKGSA